MASPLSSGKSPDFVYCPASDGIEQNGSCPIYKWAALERPGETPRWNFHKYLVGRDGHIAAVFSTQVEPTDPRVIAAIERELGAGPSPQ